MDNAPLRYSPLPGTTPQAETAALAAIYSFLMSRKDTEAAEVEGSANIEGGDEDLMLEVPKG